MKRLILFCLVATILKVNSYVIKIPTVLPDDGIVPAAVGRVHIQKLLLPLFEDVCEESTDPIIVRLSEEFKTDPRNGKYVNPEITEDFVNLMLTKGLIAKGEIFTEYNKDHMSEFKIIYEMLMNAENFDTFYKTASWARQNVNCGIFVNAIYLAIMKRKDTERVLLPPVYEVLPNYFIRKDYIMKASSLISGVDSSLAEYVRDDGNSYVLDVNYTDTYFDNNIEQMSYFYEDVGLNSYYFLNKLKRLKWSNNQILDTKNSRGEYLYNNIKQLNTRYNLERYSNGIPEVEAIDWNSSDECVYDPMLIYSNGHEFSQRALLKSGNTDYILLLKNIEDNVSTTVTRMRDEGYNKSEIFNYLMDILLTGEMSYENVAMQHLSNVNSQTGTTSVLGHYMTTLRDPIFWRLNKRIVEIVDNAIKVLPAYERNQLYFPGVEVINVDIKKPATSCDKYEFYVTDALENKDTKSKFQVKINQNRLSHKPFMVKISVSSLVMEKAFIKLFIGPKVLPGQYTDRKNLFMQLDSFEVNLKIGSNTITRTSDEMNNLSDDLISLKTIRKYIQDTKFGIDALPLRTIDLQIGFPSRLILPKGTTAPFQIFVFVAPFVKAIVGGTRNYLQSNYDAISSPGYPLDLDIEIQNLFDLPNALVKDIMITHKGNAASQMSTNNSYYNWKKDETEFSKIPNQYSSYSKPNYSTKKFDYKSNKEKYGQKQETMETKIFENAKVITVNDENNKNIIKDKQDKNKIIFPGSIINNEINNLDTNTHKFESKLVSDYEKVITIDKNVNDMYPKDKQDEEENTQSENVVFNIASKGGVDLKNQDEIKTKTTVNDFNKVISVDRNINVKVQQDDQDEKEKNKLENLSDAVNILTQPNKELFNLWWNQPL